MAGGKLETVVRQIRQLAAGAAIRDIADRQLLELFSQWHDETAFAELVRRHGPLVWKVCRHVVGHEQDAEDAFQATFLALALKSAALRKVTALAGWLHGAAFRSAVQIKRQAARRRRHEQQASLMPRRESQNELAWQELQAVLDEEVQRLAEKHRTPFVLCCLEGKSKTEAAKQLGWKEGTVSGRLAQARKQLQKRLSSRGVSLSAVLAGTVVAQGATAATVPGALAQATVGAAVAVAASRAVTGVASATVAAAVKEATKVMWLTKCKMVTAVVLAVGTAAGAGVLGMGELAQKQAAERPPAAKAAALPKPEEVKQDRIDRYGDPLPAGAITRFGTVRFRPAAYVFDLAFSPNGTILASSGAYHGGEDRSIHLWDVTTGAELRKLVGHERSVPSLAFSPDGKMLASGSEDRTIRLWDVAAGKELRRCGEKLLVDNILAFSRDGKVLASTYPGTYGEEKVHPITLWDTSTGKEVRALQGQEGIISSLVFSPNGTTLAAAGTGSVIYLWDVAPGKELRQIQAGTANHRAPVVFSPDGRVLASTNNDNTIRLWDLATGKNLGELRGHKDEVKCLAFAADSKTLVSGSRDHTIRFWDLASGKERHVRPFAGHRWDSHYMAFSFEAKTLAAGSTNSVIRLWDTATGKEIRPSSGHQSPVAGLAFLADGKTVVSTGWDGTLRLSEAATGKEVRRSDGIKASLTSIVQNQKGGMLLIYSVALSPDGKLLTMAHSGNGKGTVRVWEATSGRELHSFDSGGQSYWCIALSPGGSMLALANEENAIELRDLATGKELRRLTGHESRERGWANAILGLVFSPDGKMLASCGQDLTARLWDVATGAELYRLGHTSDVVAVAFSPDGKTLAAAGGEHLAEKPGDNSIHLWEVATGKERGRLSGHQNLVTSLAYSADGKILASGSSDSTVRLWEMVTGKELRRLEGHRGLVRSVAFSGDGKRLASGGSDTTVLVWDTANLLPKMRQAEPLAHERLATLWADLADSDAAKAYRAMAVLDAAPAQAVPFLEKHVRPAPAGDSAKVTRLIRDLDDNQFSVREKAVAELATLGEAAEPALRQAQKGQSTLEFRRRVERLLAKLLVPSGDTLRSLRAVELLEHMNGPDAEKQLEVLSKGAADARLTIEAKAALARLGRR